MGFGGLDSGLPKRFGRAVDAALTAGLDPLYRLALSYAPAARRGRYAALFALDRKLARMVEQAREPVLVQLRLAWWRDELGKPAARRAVGEPILAAIGETWQGAEQELLALVDGWEALLGERPLKVSDIETFAQGRGAAYAALAGLVGEEQATERTYLAGRRHALAEFAAQAAEDEREAAIALAGDLSAATLPRGLRPLTILDGLARRSLRRGGAPLLGDRASPLIAVRLGIFGR